MQANRSALKTQPLERRKHERMAVELPGHLFIPAGKDIFHCMVMSLSAGGAAARCETALPPNRPVTLSIEGFGNFECVTTRYAAGELGLRFVCRQARRTRLLAEIANFIEESTRLRGQPGMPQVSEIRFARPNGEQFRCGIMGSTPQGLMLQTTVRPPLGEIVHVGQTYGRVVDHQDEGIVIQFLNAALGDQQHG